MEDFDVKRLPFTSISRENWQMLVELDAETLYSVIQMVGNYVITGEECECNDVLSKVVCSQLISVINRKGKKSRNSSDNIYKRWQKAKEREPKVTVSEDTAQLPIVTLDDKENRMNFWTDKLVEVYQTQGRNAFETTKRELKDNTHSGLDAYETVKVCNKAYDAIMAQAKNG